MFIKTNRRIVYFDPVNSEIHKTDQVIDGGIKAWSVEILNRRGLVIEIFSFDTENIRNEVFDMFFTASVKNIHIDLTNYLPDLSK